MPNAPQPRVDVKCELFLEEIAQHGNISQACNGAGVAHSTIYHRLNHDPEFREKMQLALEKARDVIRAEIHRRAITGVKEPIVHQGRVVRDEQGNPIEVTRYSDPLLIKLGEAVLPEMSRRQVVQLLGASSNNGGLDRELLLKLPAEDRNAILAILQRNRDALEREDEEVTPPTLGITDQSRED